MAACREQASPYIRTPTRHGLSEEVAVYIPRTFCLALRQSSVVPSSAWRMSLTRAAQALRAASARVTRTSQLPA